MLNLASLSSLVLAVSAQSFSFSYALNISATPSLWDGHCTYPVASRTFNLTSYLGRWYQVAGTLTPFTASCTCVYAQYTANANGTVNVFNSCQVGNSSVNIEGTATPADPIYGEAGALRVQFPVSGAPACPGPNYIVQHATSNWAIVQASNFSSLFLLSRVQNPVRADLDFWLHRAGTLGSNLAKVVLTNQTGCLFT
ncbi:hypothetical protein E2P81_ATG09347 [Venturia nashicola]|uniref:Lipocalin/cytosolic fatty-acid binding domain-containing protein n=1 Tax=Venturia nashicola TaxID=86259 RepID=A0A4Z1P6T6_9PEZI|nr:hypothetical protein E6O75_ATG09554 [Venturia nashicola]TLD25690.1 hypothetical protein E2P81_ATG09347 [Venturia nashicola]